MYIPSNREADPLSEYDRDEKKLDVFLSFHKHTLTLADMKVFLPFTINLDPFIKKVVKGGSRDDRQRCGTWATSQEFLVVLVDGVTGDWSL